MLSRFLRFGFITAITPVLFVPHRTSVQAFIHPQAKTMPTCTHHANRFLARDLLRERGTINAASRRDWGTRHRKGGKKTQLRRSGLLVSKGQLAPRYPYRAQ